MFQLHAIGSFFTSQLLQSRHRGAFELAYAGFVKMADMLWRSPLAEVHRLPRQWLSQVMEDIQSDPSDSKLCSTRRSAGLPFYIQVCKGKGSELLENIFDLKVSYSDN